MSSKIVQFTRRPINEWPRRVYLADFGDGDACRPYTNIQYPDDTTPEYIRSDIANARIAKLEKALATIRDHRKKCHEYDDDVGHPRRKFDAEDMLLMEAMARATLKDTPNDQ